jgi:large subunit ribosomal protein L15
MRMRKLRGPHMKKSMPFEPFRTRTQPVNLSDLNRFEDGAEVTPESLRDRGLATRKRIAVKVLGRGELERKSLKVTAHGFSASARENIESAGGTCTVVEFSLRANGSDGNGKAAE